MNVYVRVRMSVYVRAGACIRASVCIHVYKCDSVCIYTVCVFICVRALVSAYVDALHTHLSDMPDLEFI